MNLDGAGTALTQTDRLQREHETHHRLLDHLRSCYRGRFEDDFHDRSIQAGGSSFRSGKQRRQCQDPLVGNGGRDGMDCRYLRRPGEGESDHIRVWGVSHSHLLGTRARPQFLPPLQRRRYPALGRLELGARGGICCRDHAGQHFKAPFLPLK